MEVGNGGHECMLARSGNYSSARGRGPLRVVKESFTNGWLLEWIEGECLPGEERKK